MRTAGSILLLIILVPASLAVFFVFSLKTNILTAQFLQHELAKRQVYSIAEEQIAEQIGKIKLENLPIDAMDIQALASRVLPATWLQQQVEGTISRLFAWFNSSDNAALSLPIDLHGPKAELIPGVDALIASAIPRLPECAKFPKTGELCRAQNMTLAQVKDLLKQGGIDLASVTGQLPDTVDLANPVMPETKLGDNHQQSADNQQAPEDRKKITDSKQEQDIKKKEQDPQTVEQKKKDASANQKDNQTSQEPKLSLQQQIQQGVAKLTQAKQTYHVALTIWMYALIGYCILILGFLAINIKGWRRLARWTGILALSIGLIPFAVSIASKPVLDRYVVSKINISAAPAAVQSAIPAAILDVQHALFFPVLVLSAILVALGIAAIIGAHWIPVRENNG